MKLAIVSDLHLEIWRDKFPEIDYEDADVVCFLGDIATGSDEFDYISHVQSLKEGRSCIYVPGNHEYYKHDYDETRLAIHAAFRAHPHVHYVDEDAVQLHGYTFAGATLWTDYKLGKTAKPTCMAMAAYGMNDHRLSRKDGRVFSPADALEINQRSKKFLFDLLDDIDDPNRCIFLTHHAPTGHAVAPKFAGDALNGAFCNDWGDLIEEKGPHIWAYGHTHTDIDVECGNTRIVSRQLGYPRETYSRTGAGFAPLFIELEDVA